MIEVEERPIVEAPDVQISDERLEMIIIMLREMYIDVRRVDYKVQVISGATALLVAALALAPPNLTITGVLAAPTYHDLLLVIIEISLILSIVATTLANILALRTRPFDKRRGGLFSFSGIASKDADAYTQEFLSLTNAAYARILLEELRLNGLLVATKLKWVRRSSQSFLFAALVWIASYLISVVG
ncbi:MAG: DUF5706 domain-containing protein [Anaerolineae bacterium]|nr:DUF5706 domain-containing protein [Anaerolineae bacterium]NUQ05996.1 hypothetical protein [Anaerolineae bacterium]